MVEHRGVANLMRHIPGELELNADSRVLQLASPSFDASVWEIFTTLGSGAALVLAPGDELLPGKPLQHTLTEWRVSVLTISPTLLSALDPASSPTCECWSWPVRPARPA